MVFYTNSTTKKLEGFARRRGVDYGIVISPNNKNGRYFVVTVNKKQLNVWSSLGWTFKEAKLTIVDNIDRNSAESELEKYL